MTREEVREKSFAEAGSHKYVILELPTGFGKTRLAIEMVRDLCVRLGRTIPPHKEVSVLLLVAKTVHKGTWADEIVKWGGMGTSCIVMDCYNSIGKHAGKSYDIVICDEVHHLCSELRLGIFETIQVGSQMIGLSATLKRDMKEYFRDTWRAGFVRCTLQSAIDEDVLPEPRIYALPLDMDDVRRSEVIVYNGGYGYPVVEVPYARRFESICDKEVETHVLCTRRERLEEYNGQIESCKRRFMSTGSVGVKNWWLHLCGERLRWLAGLKNSVVRKILLRFEKERTLTFCVDIKQCEELGSNCVHSRNKDGRKVYEAFNAGRIDHITACQQLNEGVNLVNCRIGIYANIHASEIITRQRMGRLLRHERPVVIVPYWRDSREEELVGRMLMEYDSGMVSEVRRISDIRL